MASHMMDTFAALSTEGRFLTILATCLSLLISTNALPQGALGGCGIRHDHEVGTTTSLSIQSSGGKRSFNVHLPEKYDATKPTAMIVAYHGHHQGAKKLEQVSMLSEETVNPHMIVVYPEGTNGAWQGAPYSTVGVSDKKFTSDILSYMSDNYCVDRGRIYATGESNGGGFVDVLACSPEHGDKFAAFAPVIGAFYSDANEQSTCRPSKPQTHMLEIHGHLDANFDCKHAPTGWCRVPYNGTTGEKPLAGIFDWLARWATRNGCAKGTQPRVEQKEGYKFMKYDCRGKDGIAQHYRVNDWGHKWPNQKTGAVIDAGNILLDFFLSIS